MRKSRQRGWIALRGKKWYGYFRKTVTDPKTNQQKRTIVTVILGLRAHMDKAGAREIFNYHLLKEAEIFDRGGVRIDGSVTFEWFVRNRYFPLKDGMWKVETAKVKKLLIERDLIDAFYDTPMKDFDKFRLQIHLNNLAKEKSKDRVLQIRAYLRDIFAEAEEQGVIAKDPTFRLRVPMQLRKVDKTILTWEQLRQVLSQLSLRDRLLLELGMTNALRPGELFALKWKSFNHERQTMTLSETVYKGKIRPWGKTEKSLTAIHIPQQLADDLLLWKQATNSAPDAFIFSNRRGNYINPDRFRKEALRKLANDLGLPKLTFQVIRRTIATRAQRMGSVKNIQGILRHSSALMTAGVYMQEISESVQMTLQSISNELRRGNSSFDDQRKCVHQFPNTSLHTEVMMTGWRTTKQNYQ